MRKKAQWQNDCGFKAYDATEVRDKFIGNMNWMYDFHAWAAFNANDNAAETPEEKLMFGCVEESQFDPADPYPLCNESRMFDINLNKVIKP